MSRVIRDEEDSPFPVGEEVGGTGPATASRRELASSSSKPRICSLLIWDNVVLASK